MRLKEDFHHTIVIERSEFICYVRKCLDEAQACGISIYYVLKMILPDT